MYIPEAARSIFVQRELCPSRSAEEIARVLKIKASTVRYQLSKLEDLKLVEPRPIVNPYKLGYIDYTYLFSLSSTKNEEQRNALIDTLVRSPEVSWVGELGGSYHYGVSILALSVADVLTYLDRLTSSFGELFHERLFSIRYASNIFGRRYISGECAACPSIQYATTSTIIELDDLDKKIISGMFEFPDLSLRGLARELQIALTTLDRRRGNLEDNGVIAG